MRKYCLLDGGGGAASRSSNDEQKYGKLQRYNHFIENWELLSERYRETCYHNYKTFTQIYGDEVERFFGDELLHWENEISVAQRRALYEYTSKTSDEINMFLRADGAGFDCADKRRLSKRVDLISGALAEFNLERNILVYRVENKDYYNCDEFVLKSFTSTSVNRRYLAINYENCVQYQIEVPAGKGRGAYIRNMSNYRAEYEFLLQRDTKVKVVRKLDDGEFKMIRLRVVD